jgi:S-disulfanyl-L-cysteine oxidoreductase SoxD
MPYPIPGSLSNDDIYAVSAYILSLNGILPADGKLDRDPLPKIEMPNRDGFIPDPVFKLDNEQGPPTKRGVAR